MSDKKNSKKGKKEKQQAISLFSHIKEIGLLKYESELDRESSLIQQSSQMQTAFAFMTAALFMAIPILLEYKADLNLSISFVFSAAGTVLTFLLISLITASIAQWRSKIDTFPDIKDLSQHIEENWESSVEPEQQLKQFVELLADVQLSRAKVNNRRVTQIIVSMCSFYASILSIVFWFMVAILKNI